MKSISAIPQAQLILTSNLRMRNRMNEEPDDSYALYCRGRTQLESGDLEAAEQSFIESLELQEHAKTAELLGECLSLQGKSAEALAALRKAVSLGGESRAPLLLAKAYLLAGDKTSAENALRESLKRNPEYHPAQRMLAELRLGSSPIVNGNGSVPNDP